MTLPIISTAIGMSSAIGNGSWPLSSLLSPSSWTRTSILYPLPSRSPLRTNPSSKCVVSKLFF